MASLNFEELNDCNFIDKWPIDIDKQLYFAYEFPTNLNNFIKNKNYSEDELFIIRSIFSEIICDFSRIVTALIDFQSCKDKNFKLIYDKNSSPIINFISSDQKIPKKISNIMPTNVPISHYQKNLKTYVKKIIREFSTRFYKNNNSIDIYNTNYLLETDTSISRKYLLQFYPETIKDTNYNHIDKKTRELSNDLCDFYAKEILNLSISNTLYINKAVNLSRIFISERIQKQKNNLIYLRKILNNNNTSQILISGTPNNLGRVISKIYRENNKSVVRYSHGGDRGFFNDPLWYYSELYETDKYVVHGKKEVSNIKNRLIKNYIPISDSKPIIFTHGSLKHQKIYNTKFKRIKKIKKIGLIFGSFTNEWAHSTISTKLPDVLLAYYHLQIMKILKNKNYIVITKPHPKGILPKLKLSKKLYSKYSDYLYYEKFDPINFESDLYIYDYAGSAWFDALATNKPIILIDFGIRKFDKEAYVDIASRCAILKVKIKNFNPSIIHEKLIIDKIDEANLKSECKVEFANNYFYK